MKKRFLPLCLVANVLALTPNTSTATVPHEPFTEPFIELEAMKMFCTVPVDLTRSNAQIAQDLEPMLSAMPWAIRLHPQADPLLQSRFEKIIQLIANNLGQVIGGFEPQSPVEEAEQVLEKEDLLREHKGSFSYYEEGLANTPPATLLKTLPMAEALQSKFEVFEDQREDDDFLEALSFPSAPSGGKGIQGQGESLFNRMGFDSFAFMPKGFKLFKSVIKSDSEVARGAWPLQERLSHLSLPLKTPTVPAQKDFKIGDFLNKLQKIALTNWVKAEVVSPFMAGLLLLLTYLRGDLVLPRTTGLLLRRRPLSPMS
tara:strand:- start:1557 stop:2498 length:942 start_codon:yes stop_codon:yes gene_type:complete